MHEFAHGPRQLLAELELTSVVRAHAHGGIVSGSGPGSRPPAGDESPASYWRGRFAEASSAELPRLMEAARAELRAIRRRRIPASAPRDGVELRARVVDDGEGLPARDLAVALRCTPTFVRRTRLAAGREAERGKRVSAAVLEIAVLHEAGLSWRAIAATTGVPRSTLHARHARSQP